MLYFKGNTSPFAQTRHIASFLRVSPLASSPADLKDQAKLPLYNWTKIKLVDLNVWLPFLN